MSKKIADSLYELYGGDFRHFPKGLRMFLWKMFGHDYRFYPHDKMYFLKMGKYEYSDLINVEDEWFVYKTWVPHIWPEVSIEEICNAQPMSGPVGLKFQLNYTYEK
jgi:hypothetical protein